MQRVRGTDALLVVVVRRRRITREQRGVVAVQVREAASHSRDGREAFGVRCLEQPAPDDLERLVLARRPPLVRDATDHVLEAFECELAVRATDLDVAAASFGAGVGCRDRDHEHHARHGAHDLGQGLGEGELGLERTGGQFLVGHELACVRHPLVDQDQRRRVAQDQGTERLTGVGASAVVLGDQVVGFTPTELPREFTPQRAHLSAVVLDDRRPGLQVGADQGDPSHIKCAEIRVAVRGNEFLKFLREVLRRVPLNRW